MNDWRNRIGLFLVAASFAASVIWILVRPSPGDGAPTDRQEPVVIRFAHVTIHPGIIRAYDDAIRDYEKLNPGVRVVQMPVPIRMWSAWLRTQMVGGNAPDLADMDRGQPDEFLARYFLPLDEWVEQPNPYNVGTELEGRRWRETFINDLRSGRAYRVNLQQVYGIPFTIQTVRLFANANLLREITGSTKVPENYAELIALCHEIEAYSERTGRTILPFAGSVNHTHHYLNRLFGSQTQRLMNEPAVNVHRSFVPIVPEVYMTAYLAYLRGSWSWRDPAVASGLTMMREIAGYTTTGFLQLQRDDSLFQFAQGRALFLPTGSWDADTILAGVPFPMAILPVPLPTTDDGVRGSLTLGPISDLSETPGNAVGVARSSRHPEIAVDFLRYLTSQPVSRRVMQDSNRLSSILGVAPPESIAGFAPRLHGFPLGFHPGLTPEGSEAERVYRSLLHRLVSRGGSVEDFTDAIERVFPAAIMADLRRFNATARETSRVDDALLVAGWVGPEAKEATTSRRLDLMLETQTLRELAAAQAEWATANAQLSSQTPAAKAP
jgi:ABC-type sugar transport system, periplasmic component